MPEQHRERLAKSQKFTQGRWRMIGVELHQQIDIRSLYEILRAPRRTEQIQASDMKAAAKIGQFVAVCSYGRDHLLSSLEIVLWRTL